MTGETWYRYVGMTHAEGFDIDRGVHLVEYRVVSETTRTVLLVRSRDFIGYTEYGQSCARTHRVLKDARKRFAYPTKALAFNSFRIRQNHRLARLEFELENVKAYRAAVAVVQGLLPSLT